MSPRGQRVFSTQKQKHRQENHHTDSKYCEAKEACHCVTLLFPPAVEARVDGI